MNVYKIIKLVHNSLHISKRETCRYKCYYYSDRHELTKCNRRFLGRLVVTQMVNKFYPFMEFDSAKELHMRPVLSHVTCTHTFSKYR
jgi:hypothetical protein